MSQNIEVYDQKSIAEIFKQCCHDNIDIPQDFNKDFNKDFDKDFRCFVIPKKLQQKCYLKNKNKIYSKLLDLTALLWDMHSIALFNHFSCCGRCGWMMLNGLNDNYKCDEIKGIIGWYIPLYSPLEKNEKVQLLSLMEHDEIEKYVHPILDELNIDYNDYYHTTEIVFDGFELPNLLPEDFD